MIVLHKLKVVCWSVKCKYFVFEVVDRMRIVAMQQLVPTLGLFRIRTFTAYLLSLSLEFIWMLHEILCLVIKQK